jgi:hypothetical protein
MLKYLCLIATILILSCGTSEKHVNFTVDYQFMPQHQNNMLDHQVGPVIAAYQELIKGLSQKDTIYMNETTNELVRMTDSLAGLQSNLDSTRQKIWEDGLGNLNAELQGLQMADKVNGLEEIKMSIHMCGLQLLNLLSQMGYKEHQVYIFNTEDTKMGDGYVWLSFQKMARDPFNPENRKEISAQEVLQELK